MTEAAKLTDRLIDPSDNTRMMLAADVKRLNDLRETEHRYDEILRGVMTARLQAESHRLDTLQSLHVSYGDKLAIAEAKRIDAIRAVDVAAVAVANERATAQAAVLANQVAASAETLRALVAATASTQAQQLTQLTNQLTDRLASLEKSQYEGKGSSGGMRDMYGWLIGGLMLLIAAGGLIFALR